MTSLVVLISGNGSNLKALLDACENPLFPGHILAVGADKAAPGLAHADDFGVASFVVEPRRFSDIESWSEVLAQHIRALSPDLIVLAGFMKILPRSFIREFGPRVINLHPSLLPEFPGSHAIDDALAAGVSETGCTIHVVDSGIDTGPVLAQAKVEIDKADTKNSLAQKIHALEHVLLVKTVREIATGKIKLEEINVY